MALKMLASLVGINLFLFVHGDIYMHSFRGSNNRLKERTAVRTNANRLFDSQNNNRGGYNVGDRGFKPHRNSDGQYRMQYFQSSPTSPSKIKIEWTQQHGCGGNEDNNPHKMNCNNVLQFMCQEDLSHLKISTTLTRQQKGGIAQGQMRDGTSQITNGHAGPSSNKARWLATHGQQNHIQRGMHEPYQWYDKCKTRDRNKGLFTADQNLQGKDASIYTRQNNNGNRHGYECPEERDYYPYWHPTDWKDIMVYAQNESMCEYYRNESFNVKSKWECVEKWTGSNERKHFSKHNNEAACTSNGGEWLEFHNFLEKATDVKTEDDCKAKGYIWGRPIYGYELECLVPLAAPECQEAQWTRVNHLGNGAKGDLETPSYEWTLPHFPSRKKQRCVIRIRYNISTDDYDPYHTDSTSNGNTVIQKDPLVDIGASGVKLQLNIDTAQFGRTFSDRSHLFKILPRPRHTEDYTIYNVQVRGKRGNIVQVYPAVEYDFSPTVLNITENDIVHIQWTGSNTHNNGKPGGDGQTGDAGQGRRGTDRHNLVAMTDLNHNYPSLSESSGNLFNNIKYVHWGPLIKDLGNCDYEYTPTDVYVQYASSGYFPCAQCGSKYSLENQRKAMDDDLDNAPASYRGMLLQFNPGEYPFMSTRNNAFTNRSQKGKLIVSPSVSPAK